MHGRARISCQSDSEFVGIQQGHNNSSTLHLELTKYSFACGSLVIVLVLVCRVLLSTSSSSVTVRMSCICVNIYVNPVHVCLLYSTFQLSLAHSCCPSRINPLTIGIYLCLYSSCPWFLLEKPLQSMPSSRC